jgi:glycosyltransferase involved in cell wall biosynthesis
MTEIRMKISRKRITVSVTNDLTTDQRVDRVCSTLTRMGFEVTLVGRRRRTSMPLAPRIYRTRRMSLVFGKGPQFYAEYNIRLFLYLLFHKADLILSNDLDTLLASFLASRLKFKPLVHDCHEYFRGVPELNRRKNVVRAWKAIEDGIFPRLKTVYAVNSSIAGIYHKEYGNDVKVIRNVPVTKTGIIPIQKSELGIPGGSKVILYQGAVNVDRGLEEAILAMKHVVTPAILLIIGTGDIFEGLKKLVRDEQLTGKVILTGPIAFQDLPPYTMMADIGLSIEKDVSLNYHYCLPNKFMDYIQANIPVLISPLPEMAAIVDKYRIGMKVESHEPAILASTFDRMLNDDGKLAHYKKNLKEAAADLCWENEEKELNRIFEPYA